MDTEYVWVVYSRCDCEGVWCCGMTDIAVFKSEQTARQEADLRSKRYGGAGEGMAHQHIDRVKISTKISGF